MLIASTLPPSLHRTFRHLKNMSGLFVVYTEPGSAISSEEFNDWYDNEHIPVLTSIPSFHSWSRWVATDGKQASYVAVYDIDSPNSIKEPPYTSVIDALPEREKNILCCLALIDHRAYSLHQPVHPPKAGHAYDVRTPGPFMSSVAFDVPGEHIADFNKWHDEEHIPLFSKIPGWVRTRRFVFEDGGVHGTDESLKPVGVLGPQKFFALHEWETLDALASEEYEAAISTPWALKFKEVATRFELRVFRLLRTWGRE